MLSHGPLVVSSVESAPVSQGCESDTCIDRMIESSPPRDMARLSRAVRAWGRGEKRSGTVIVLVVTEGYEDMFVNFLCFASSLSASPPPSSAPTPPTRNLLDHFLVLTPHPSVVRLCSDLNVSVYLTAPTVQQYGGEVGTGREGGDGDGVEAFPAESSFGSLLYQELMLRRSQVCLDLLLQGHKVLLVDIDTVWLKDPLAVIDHYEGSDILVTRDGEEVCGGFLYLNTTRPSLGLWRRLVEMHEDLVAKARLNGGVLPTFFSSEQKFLTALLFSPSSGLPVRSGEYLVNGLRFHVLPEEMFPSGDEFFGVWTSTSAPGPPERAEVVVVHNNYIVGKDSKIFRFMRYGLWRVRANTRVASASRAADGLLGEGICSSGSAFAGTDPALHPFAFPLQTRFRRPTIPHIFLLEPAHDSVLSGDRIYLQAHQEGPFHDIDSNGYLHADFNAFPVSRMLFCELYVPVVNPQVSFSWILNGAMSQGLSVDVSLASNGLMAIDFGGDRDVANVANERAYRFTRCQHWTEFSGCGSLQAPTLLSLQRAGNAGEITDALRFSIRVLAYNRPQSLQRLLLSLARAHYDEASIPLYIYVDGPRSIDVSGRSHV